MNDMSVPGNSRDEKSGGVLWENRDMRKRSKAVKKTGRAVCAAPVLCAALLLAACAGQDAPAVQGGQDAPAVQDGDWLAERTERDRRTKQDLRTEPEDMEKTERVDLDACENGQVILSGGGDIWLSGSLEGQVVIDAEEDELVHLYLAGAEITSLNGPALCVEEAAKVVVTLVSDTENVLADSPDYTDHEETPACLYSVCDLTVNGNGALQIFGYHGDGIRSKDRIRLLDGTLSVQAKGDGVRGNDGIYMQEAFVDIESEKNGLRTVNQGADDRGVIEISGGALSVVAGQNGISAASDLYLYGGRYSVNAVEERVRTEGTAYIAE
ncbi:MAG: carbohydrate-binding domain-containing protein [Lachnospiraceae bacterium]|nr:carbohydrate-binding domain-containing protein [Lachnospiraceae bacterium]